MPVNTRRKSSDLLKMIAVSLLFTFIFLFTLFNKIDDLTYKKALLLFFGIISFSLFIILSLAEVIDLKLILPSSLLGASLLFHFSLFSISPDTTIPGMEHFRIDAYVILSYFIGHMVLLHYILKQKIHEQIRKNPIVIYVFLLIISAILATPFVHDKKLHLIWFVFIFVILYSSIIFHHSITRQKDLNTIFIIFTSISGIFIFTTFIISPVENSNEGIARFAGVFRNPNEMGIFAAYTFFLFLYGINTYKNKFLKLIFVIFSLMSLVAISRSASRNAFLNVLIGLWFVFLLMGYYKKRKFVYLVVGLIFSLLATLLFAGAYLRLHPTLSSRFTSMEKGDVSILFRIVMLHNTWKYLLVHPIHFLLGHGQVQFYYYPTLSYHYKSPHNIFMDFLFSFGIIGVIALIYLAAFMFKTAMASLKKHLYKDFHSFTGVLLITASLIVFWVSSLFDEVQWHMGSLQAIYFFAPYTIIVLKLLKQK